MALNMGIDIEGWFGSGLGSTAFAGYTSQLSGKAIWISNISLPSGSRGITFFSRATPRVQEYISSANASERNSLALSFATSETFKPNPARHPIRTKTNLWTRLAVRVSIQRCVGKLLPKSVCCSFLHIW